MKKFLTLTLGLAALAFGVFLSVGMNQANAQSTTEGQTELGGIACTPGSDISVTTYDIDYGTATAAEFVAGFTNAGTESGGNYVVLNDECGTKYYDVEVSYQTMIGADNGDTIPASWHALTNPVENSSVGTLMNEVTIDPNTAAPWSGNHSILLLQRLTYSGAVGSVDVDLTHSLKVEPETLVYDSSYDGTWTITWTLYN